MHNGIIFDLDGTLVDSLADIAGSVNRVLGRAGFPLHPEGDFRLMVGNGMRVLVSRVLPEEKRDEDTINRLRGEVEAEYESHCLEFTRPYPGILELIEALKARSCRSAVLSNKPDGFTKRIIEALFPSGSFDIVQGQREGIPTKPDPSSALAIADTWALAPSSLIFLGDSSVDMETGVAAGMCSLGAAWGFRSREELVNGGARGIISRPSELLEWL